MLSASPGQSSCIVCVIGMFSAGGVDQCSSAPRIVVSNACSACGAAFCATCGVGTWCDCQSYDQFHYSGDRRLQTIDADAFQDVDNELFLSDYSTEQSDNAHDVAAVLHKENPLYLTFFASWCSACPPDTFSPGNALGYPCLRNFFFAFSMFIVYFLFHET